MLKGEAVICSRPLGRGWNFSRWRLAGQRRSQV